jgi:hypothetical protein
MLRTEGSGACNAKPVHIFSFSLLSILMNYGP